MQSTTTHRRTTAAGLALTLALAAPGAARAMTSRAEGKQGGLSWLDLAIALGILGSIVLLGLWGDVVVGAVIASIWTLVEVTIKLGTIGLRPASRREDAGADESTLAYRFTADFGRGGNSDAFSSRDRSVAVAGQRAEGRSARRRAQMWT